MNDYTLHQDAQEQFGEYYKQLRRNHLKELLQKNLSSPNYDNMNLHDEPQTIFDINE